MPFLSARALQNPNAPAIECLGERWDYQTLNSWAEFLAISLEQNKITKGTHVGVHFSSLPVYQPAHIAIIHALARVGAVMVPLNTRLTNKELKWQLDKAECHALLCSQDFYYDGKELLGSDERLLSYEPALPLKQIPAALRPPLAPDSVQGIFFTSGTTGFPKGAALTFDNFHANALASAERLGVHPHDRWLLTMPLYHIGGMTIVFRSAIYGTEIVLHSNFDVDKVHRALTQENISIVSLVPTMLHRLLEKYPNFKPSSSLRVILLGGASASESLIQKSLALNLPLALTYGLTEATSQAATSTPEQTRAKPGSVGKPLSGTTVTIVDDAGKPLPNGEVGEIVISGKTVMQGYLDSERPDRFLYTGDIGYLDSDGDLWVLTRRTDLIVSGGENIYPEEIERALASHPSVSEACVVGLPDPAWGQSVAAAVVARESVSAENLIHFLRGEIAGYKIPKQILFVESLPHTASGKLKRAEIKDLTGFKILSGLNTKL